MKQSTAHLIQTSRQSRPPASLKLPAGPKMRTAVCLLYGFGVALGGLPPFLVQGSRFEVHRSTFSLRPEPQTQESRLPARRRLEAPRVGSKLSTASVRRVSGECPARLP